MCEKYYSKFGGELLLFCISDLIDSKFSIYFFWFVYENEKARIVLYEKISFFKKIPFKKDYDDIVRLLKYKFS